MSVRGDAVADDVAKSRPEPAPGVSRAGPPPTPEPAPESLLPLEIAMGAEHDDPDPDSPARRVLLKQERLIHEQIALARNERFRNRIKAARDAALAALAIAVVAGGAWVVWDASRADGVVIEPFAVAPSLAQQGLTGEVVANRLLGRIAAMQVVTESSRVRRSARGGGEDELSVEIPQTGVSAGEIVRLLRRRLGHETVVTGELAPDGAGGFALHVYVDGLPVALPAAAPEAAGGSAGAAPRAAAGEARTASPVDRLLDRGAEAVFSKTEPYRYSSWLITAGRPEESTAARRALSARGSPEERAWAFSGLSQEAREAGRFDEALAFAAESVRLNPDLPNGYGNIGIASGILGHDERELRARRQMLAAARRSRDFRAPSRGKAGSAAAVARLRGDYASMTSAAEEMTRLAETHDNADSALATRAHAQAARHEVSAARRTAAGLSKPLAPGARSRKNLAIVEQATLEDWRVLEAELSAPVPAVPQQIGFDRGGPGIDVALTARRYRPVLAYAIARQGRTAEAAAMVSATPLDCYLCVRMRGAVAAEARDWPAAERWFAEAVRQGPSLPFAHAEWGQARLARGDARGAIRLFREAQKRGPRWADPLKLEGDALARSGDHRGAIRRYRATAERAPRWGALHLAWGRSLAALGRSGDARAKYAQAARLDLSAADRAEVARLLARRAG